MHLRDARPAPRSFYAPPSSSPSPAGLPSAGNVTATIPSVGPSTITDDFFGVAADDSDVWVFNGETGKLSRGRSAGRSSPGSPRSGCFRSLGDTTAGRPAAGPGPMQATSVPHTRAACIVEPSVRSPRRAARPCLRRSVLPQSVVHRLLYTRRRRPAAGGDRPDTANSLRSVVVCVVASVESA